MSSKRRTAAWVLVVALLAAIAVVSAPIAPAKQGATCKRAHSRTIAQNRQVRVYEVKRSSVTTLYACRRSSGRHARLARAFPLLGSDDGQEIYSAASFDRVRLRGLYVAWASTFTDASCKAACPPDYDGTSESIKVYNVRRRRERTVAGFPLGEALVLSKFGGVAWASRTSTTGRVEIRGSARSGDNRVFDSGDIDPSSLAIEITIISWTRDGQEQFARLR